MSIVGKLGKGVSKSPEQNAKSSASLKIWWAKRKANGWTMPEEQRLNIAKGHTNNPNNKFPRPKSESWRKNQSQKMKGNKNATGYAAKHVAECKDPNCRFVICNQPNSSMTGIHQILLKLLDEFPEVIPEYPWGLYHVDAYLPKPYHLAFEADGEYWHKNTKEFDTSRDQYLWDWFGLPVIRLTETELNEIGKLLCK